MPQKYMYKFAATTTTLLFIGAGCFGSGTTTTKVDTGSTNGAAKSEVKADLETRISASSSSLKVVTDVAQTAAENKSTLTVSYTNNTNAALSGLVLLVSTGGMGTFSSGTAVFDQAMTTQAQSAFTVPDVAAGATAQATIELFATYPGSYTVKATVKQLNGTVSSDSNALTIVVQ